jgi:hypothetical protein
VFSNRKKEEGEKETGENFVRLWILFFLPRRQTSEGRYRYAYLGHRE